MTFVTYTVAPVDPPATCIFCDEFCFVLRVKDDGSIWDLATCEAGAAHDQKVGGATYLTTREPTQEDFARFCNEQQPAT